MDKKSKVRAKLEATRALDGVFTTEAAQPGTTREAWQSVARDVAEDRLSEAATRSESLVRDQFGPDTASAVEMFSGNEVLREQVAGFAAAGIGIFHAGKDYAALTPTERRDRGGSAAVTRVMLEGTPILLESQRIIAGFATDATPAKRKAILDRHRLIELPSAGLPPGLIRLATADAPALSVALDLMEEDAVAFAEPDFIEHIGPRYVPTDPLFAQQWHPVRIAARARSRAMAREP